MQDAGETQDSLDITEVLTVERCYQLQGVGTANRSMVLRSCWVMNDSYYCDMSFSCGDCFGCFGIRQKQYCILNKQYSKEEYAKLKDKIVAHMKKTGEWGNYFPPEMSPFGYNETVAQIYFPLTKDEATSSGYPWYDRPEDRNYKPTMRPGDIPEKILETLDSILNEIITCSSREADAERKRHSECATAFRVVPLELMLYRKLGIPVPSKCFPCRRTDRFALFNPRRLWHRKCQCAGSKSENNTYKNVATHFHATELCPNEFETSYAPERTEIVYCESCYNSEVV